MYTYNKVQKKKRKGRRKGRHKEAATDRESTDWARPKGEGRRAERREGGLET